MQRRGAERDAGFAVMTTVIIALVVSMLVAGLLTTVYAGLKQSRKSGDSANALQVADAGVNAAVKKLADYAGPGTFTLNETLSGTGDSYQVTATKETNGLWHVDAIGIDGNGQRRHVRSDAVAGSLFANAVFAQTTLNFGSGVAVDSYIDGLTLANTCHLRGFVGTNNPGGNDLNVQGGGNGVRNCTEQIPKYASNPKGDVYDGCIGYADAEPVPHFQNEGNNATKHTCGVIQYNTPKIPIQQFDVASIPLTATSLNCTSALNLPPGKYRYNSITLGNGCVVPDSTATQDNPVLLYTDGPVNIGSGNNQEVNRPPSAASCPNVDSNGSHGDYYSGTDQSPLWYYCTGWPGRLQIYAKGGGSGVSFANHVRFWGVIYAPDRTFTGGPHPIVWGAFTGNSVDSGAQFSVHYDEALANLTNGRYVSANWREEPLP